jgi:hypothetical protein
VAAAGASVLSDRAAAQGFTKSPKQSARYQDHPNGSEIDYGPATVACDHKPMMLRSESAACIKGDRCYESRSSEDRIDPNK